MKKSYILALCAILLWSTMATVSKLLLGSFSSFQVLCVSSLVAFLFLLILCICNGKIKLLKDYKPKDYLITALIGLPGLFFYYVFYYTGASMMLASQAFIINYLWPIMSVVFACIILKEKMTFRKVIAIIISFIGVIIVSGKDLFNFNANFILGAVCCVMGAVSYGLFTALNKKVSYDKTVSTMIFYLVTFIICLIINIFDGRALTLDAYSLPGLIWNGIGPMAIANTLWALALVNGSTGKISNLAYITPFVSLIWTRIFLSEPISLTSVLGLAVIVLGIFVQLFENKKRT